MRALNWKRVDLIELVEAYCEREGVDPEKAYADFLASLDDEGEAKGDTWGAIEYEAMKGLAEGWQEIPENVSLIYRS